MPMAPQGAGGGDGDQKGNVIHFSLSGSDGVRTEILMSSLLGAVDICLQLLYIYDNVNTPPPPYLSCCCIERDGIQGREGS